MSMLDDVLGLGRTGAVQESAEFEPELENCTLESATDLSDDIDLNEFMIEAAFNNERNMIAIDNAIMCEEYSYLLNNGSEMVYEAGTISNIIEAAKKAVLKVWDTIQSYLKSVQNAINATAEANFKKKYRTIASVGSVKINGSKALFDTSEARVKQAFNMLKQCATAIGDAKSAETAENTVNKLFKVKSMDKVQEAIDKMVGVVKKSDMDAFEASATDAWKFLDSYSSMKATVKTLYGESKKLVSDVIKSLKDLEKNAKTKKIIPTEESKKIHDRVKLANKCSSLIIYTNRASVKKINQGRSQAKAVIIAIAKKNAEAKQEAAQVESATGSYLDNIEFV